MRKIYHFIACNRMWGVFMLGISYENVPTHIEKMENGAQIFHMHSTFNMINSIHFKRMKQLFWVELLFCYMFYREISMLSCCADKKQIPTFEIKECCVVRMSAKKKEKCHPAMWKFYLWCSFRTFWAFGMNGTKHPPNVCVYDKPEKERKIVIITLILP